MSHALQAPDASAEALMGEIVDEFLERLGGGERPEVEEYARRYPQLAAILRHMLPAVQVIHLSAADHPRPTERPATEIEPQGPLGDFRIVREIGRGGMGIVYEAVQISLGRRVALKVLPFAAALDAKQLQRFKNEAQAAAHLHHQNIVPVYAVGCERGVHFYAMQYIEGHTLAALIQELRRLAGLEPEGQGGPRGPVSEAASELASGRGVPAQSRPVDFQPPCPSLPAPATPEAAEASRVPVAPAADTFRPPAAAVSTEHSTSNPTFFRTVANLAVQAAEALEHAHGLGVVHRDVKPANLLVDGRGNLWMADFGLAYVQTDTRLTLTGDLVGTLRYMSPEQALAQPVGVSHRTDLYSLGATLYELLTLEPALNGRDRQELLRQIAFEEPKPPRRVNKAVPAELETIVLKAMAKNPAERYATAQELADDLERFLKEEPIRAKRPTLVQRARKWARRHRPVVWSTAAGLLMALAVLVGSVGWVVRDRAARQAKIATDLQAALEEAERSQRAGRWPQAQAAAKRAEALLQDGAAEPALAERVQGLLRELAEQEADRRLVARLEEVRLLQAEVNVKEDRFLLERALPEYRQAFQGYGLQAEARAPAEAAALLRRRPPAVRGTLVAALDHWLDLARREKSSEADWLERVLSAADADAWRQRLRAARGRRDRQALEQLARDVDIATQPPQALFLLDRALHACGAKEDAVALLRRAQEAFPGDFWTNQNLGMALLPCQPPQLDEAIRFLTVAVALRPDSPGARLNLGVALVNKHRFDEAVAACHKAIDLKPDYAMAHTVLGSALWGKGRLDEAVAACRQAIALKPDFAEAHAALGNTLWRKGRLDEAVAACRQAIALKPDLPEAHFHLGNALRVKGRFDEAVAAYCQAIDLKPAYAEAHCNLGVSLDRKGRPDEAIAAYRKAVELKPDLFEAHFNLGNLLTRRGRLDEAVVALRKVTDLKPDYPMVHYDLGNALRKKGQLGEAVAAYRQAIALKPDYAEAHCNLGHALRQQGELAQALAALKRGHELGSRRPDWPYASARWVKECQQLSELEGRLPAVLRGETQPADAAERNAYALLCYDKKLYVAAARLRASALIADPKLADDLRAGCRSDAACAAALAGCGQGADAGQLDNQERVRWRKQALEWLRADLAAYGKLLESGQPKDRQLVLHRLRGWQGQQDLASLRDLDAVVKLPAGEQEACQQLWAEVQVLLTKAEAAE